MHGKVQAACNTPDRHLTIHPANRCSQRTQALLQACYRAASTARCLTTLLPVTSPAGPVVQIVEATMHTHWLIVIQNSHPHNTSPYCLLMHPQRPTICSTLLHWSHATMLPEGRQTGGVHAIIRRGIPSATPSPAAHRLLRRNSKLSLTCSPHASASHHPCPTSASWLLRDQPA